MFGAWLIAAEGWVKLLAPLWLIYPAWTLVRWGRTWRRSRAPTVQSKTL
jgi:hypothetical protein